MNYLRGIALRKKPAADSYLATLPAVRHLQQLSSLEFRQPVTFFVGENGSGKSTLLEAIAVAMGFNAEGGSRDFSFSTRDSHSELWQLLTTVKTLPPKDGFFLRAESFYNTASYLDENSTLQRYGGLSLHEQSHGEAFLSLMLHRFEGQGLYLLDEPEAALSPQRIMAMLVALHDLVKKDSQFIIATHSPLLMAYPQAEILHFGPEGIRPQAYRETEHYQLTRRFLADPERMLRELLDE